MLIKRTARWLLACGTLVLLAGRAWAQVPANSNLDYQTSEPTYENGSAPFAESAPQSPSLFGKLLPFGNMGTEPIMRWFGPAETSTYGNGPRANIGWFGSYERVYWSLAKPTTSQIGSPTATGFRVNPLFPLGKANSNFDVFPPTLTFDRNLVDYTNSVDTGFMQANGAWGNRIELGYIDTDNHGWMVGVLEHVSQGQFHTVTNAQIQFNDPGHLLDVFQTFSINNSPPFSNANPPFLGNTAPVDLGKVPTFITNLSMKNILTLNGVELMRMYRAPRLHDGGYFDLLYGARWLQIADTFTVTGTNTVQPNTLINGMAGSGISTTSLGVIGNTFGPLSDSMWSTRVQNNLIGPQIGGRWFKQRGHWVTSLEARFVAAANFQNVHQITNLGDQAFSAIVPTIVQTGVGTSIPPNFISAYTGNGTLNFLGLGTNSHAFTTTFAPVGEIRANAAYQVASTVAIKVGYTGLVVDGISRASNRVDYSGPNLISISHGGTHEFFFANGLNFGVEINR